MIVTSVEIIPVRLPLREPFVVAYASYPDTLSVLVRIRTRDGAEGWGEATPDPNVTGETWGGTTETLRRDLAPALIGHDARNREAALYALDARVEGAPAAKAALDIALHDLVARAAEVPLWQLLGGRAREALQISRVISMGEPTAMAAAATRHVADGFRTVKVKVGDAADPLLDASRVAAVRQAVGAQIAIKVDANQGWRSPGTAIAAIRAMAPSLPAYVEQPVLWWDMEGLAEVRRQTGAIIMIDEGCHGPRDMLRAVSLRAADLVNIKLMKSGGVLNATETQRHRRGGWHPGAGRYDGRELDRLCRRSACGHRHDERQNGGDGRSTDAGRRYRRCSHLVRARHRHRAGYPWTRDHRRRRPRAPVQRRLVDSRGVTKDGTRA